MSVEQDLQALIEPLVIDLGYEYVGLEYLSNPKNRVVRLYVDRPGVGVTLDDCSLVSREVSALLDVEDPVSGHYTLEVSSPGVERPLFTPAQFLQFAGERAVVHLEAPENGRRKYQGRIVRIDDGRLVLLEDGGEVAVQMDNVRKAHLAPDMDALLKTGGRDTMN